MGYILPITHYSYINYEHRMRKSDKSPHYIDKPSKVVFGVGSESVAKDFNHGKTDNHFERTVQVKSDVKVQLTGKGKHVNAEV